MNTSSILDVVKELAPPRYAALWDNCGVQVAGNEQQVARVAVALDPTPDFVRVALDWGAQFLLTHHPLYLEPVAPALPGRYWDVLRMLLGSGAWLYGAHTSLDCRPGGPAFWLGRALGLTDVRVLEPLEPGSEAGFGQLGRLPSPLAWDEFEKLLAGCVARKVWAEIGVRPQLVESVAYLPGSGSSAMGAAAQAGADVFITGDIKYHQALDAPLFTIDIGHHVLEEEMTRLFAAELDAGLSGVEVRFFGSEEPFRFNLPTR